jgi:hypothetical protein
MSELALIPTKKEVAKRATKRVPAHVRFKRLFEFIEACLLGKIKRIFPNVFQMSSKLGYTLCQQLGPYIQKGNHTIENLTLLRLRLMIGGSIENFSALVEFSRGMYIVYTVSCI